MVWYEHCSRYDFLRAADPLSNFVIKAACELELCFDDVIVMCEQVAA